MSTDGDQGSEMRVIGSKPEADGSSKYVADLVLRLVREGSKRWAVVEKNRYEPALGQEGLPARFELTKEKPLMVWLEPMLALAGNGTVVSRVDDEQEVAATVQRMAEAAPVKAAPVPAVSKPEIANEAEARRKEVVGLITAFGLKAVETRAYCLETCGKYQPENHPQWLKAIREYAALVQVRALLGADVSPEEAQAILARLADEGNAAPQDPPDFRRALLDTAERRPATLSPREDDDEEEGR